MDGVVLVLDCIAGTLADALLLARLGTDEPSANAGLVAALYLADATRGHCRRARAADLDPPQPIDPPEPVDPPAEEIRDSAGRVYRLREVQAAPSLPELRWTQSEDPCSRAPVALTLRDVVAAVESYEPALSLTARAISAAACSAGVSSQRLAQEAQRLAISPIVLNRGLRECVQHHLSRGVSMSEIAIRCGRTKRDRAGNRSGETTWLARRIGLLPEAGREGPTPWVHSDTLALIARSGLGVSPREVEL